MQISNRAQGLAFTDLLPFSAETWIDFQRHLVTADIVIQELAKAYQMKFLTNQPFHGGGEWPTRSLQKKKWLTVLEIRVSLNPDYLQDKRVFYQLTEHARGACCGYGKLLKYTKVAEYSVDQISDRALLEKDLKVSISRII